MYVYVTCISYVLLHLLQFIICRNHSIDVFQLLRNSECKDKFSNQVLKSAGVTMKQDRQCTSNVTLCRISVTIVATGKLILSHKRHDFRKR
jgi:hypothetical protein